MSGRVGVWLSGGVDSRAMAAELDRNRRRGRFDALHAYTYDSNPPGGGNPELAASVADALDVPIEEVDAITPDRFLSVLPRAVEVTDGMVHWRDMLNIASAFHLPADAPGVVVEASGQGELLGEQVWRHYLAGDDPVDALFHSRSRVSGETVERLLGGRVDPRESFRTALADSPRDDHRAAVLDANWRSGYSRNHMASNHVARTQVGTRTPFADGSFLAHVARIPDRYALGTVPATNGSVPYSVTRPKLGLVRELDPDLADIRYDRTMVSPSRSYHLHNVGFAAKEGARAMRRALTDGGGDVVADWYRSHPGLRSFVDGLLDDACARGRFDADVLREVQRDHRSGEDRLDLLSPVTTVELWLQTALE